MLLSFLSTITLPLCSMELTIDKLALSRQLHRTILMGENIETLLHKSIGTSSFCIDSVINGYTPFHCAAVVRNVKAAQLLTTCGAQVDARGLHGCTPLHFAVGSIKLMAVLLCAQANPNIPDDNGNTPLHWAAHLKHRECTQLLINHGALYLKNKHGEYPALHWAREVELVQFKQESEDAQERRRQEIVAKQERRRKEEEAQEKAEILSKERDELEQVRRHKAWQELQERRRKEKELAYLKHVDQVALENAPEILHRDYWTGDVLVLEKGSIFAGWIRYDEMMRIKNDPDYGSRSIFSAHIIHRSYCKECPYAHHL